VEASKSDLVMKASPSSVPQSEAPSSDSRPSELSERSVGARFWVSGIRYAMVVVVIVESERNVTARNFNRWSSDTLRKSLHSRVAAMHSHGANHFLHSAATSCYPTDCLLMIQSAFCNILKAAPPTCPEAQARGLCLLLCLGISRKPSDLTAWTRFLQSHRKLRYPSQSRPSRSC
jgi:hypothetical protein